MTSPQTATRREPDPEAVASLKQTVINELKELNSLRSEPVEHALWSVPRHLFVPDQVALEQAYATERAEVTKRDEHGNAISSVSAVRVQAFMLEQAHVLPGMRVLEIGSGGYNAALLAELVGEHGEVTTIDIDPEVVERARACLAATGYDRIRVLQADGEHGEPTYAPYDRIIVTVEAPDIPPAWTEQLAPGGRIVAPLRVRGLTRSVAFEQENERLVSRSYELCGFVPFQGIGRNDRRSALLHDAPGERVHLYLDDGQQIDADRLRDALTTPRAEVWSGVTIGARQSWEQMDLWLATELPDWALLSAEAGACERHLVASTPQRTSPVLLDSDSFAYRTLRATSPERTLFEFGAVGHGPHAERAAHRLAEHMRTWDEHYRPATARFEVHPAGAPDDRLAAGRVVDKQHTRITISWP